VSDEVTLTFLGAQHPAINWSQGGVLIADSHPDLPVGAKVSGVLSIRGHGGFFRFTAELLRRDVEAGQVAFRLEKLSPTLLDALSRLGDRAAVKTD
jgi:hypothetical protein